MAAPDDAEYEAVRAVYNGMIDKRPAAVVRVIDVDEVVSTLNFAASTGSTSPSAAVATARQNSAPVMTGS